MNKKILSYNVAAWRWRITDEKYEDRLRRSCRFIKQNAPQAFLIGLQEIIVGEKYLKVLQEEFPSYKIVFPKAYDLKKNRRSAISILMIDSEGVESYSLEELKGLEDSARYNYATVNANFGCYRVLNVNIPQTAFFNNNAALWYRESRNRMREMFKTVILEEAETYRSEKDINFILLGDTNSSPQDSFILSLANNYQQPMMETLRMNEKNKITWKNSQLKREGCIDHIFYSMGMMESDALKIHYTDVLEQTIQDKMSDHACIRGSFDTYIEI